MPLKWLALLLGRGSCVNQYQSLRNEGRGNGGREKGARVFLFPIFYVGALYYNLL